MTITLKKPDVSDRPRSTHYNRWQKKRLQATNLAEFDKRSLIPHKSSRPGTASGMTSPCFSPKTSSKRTALKPIIDQRSTARKNISDFIFSPLMSPKTRILEPLPDEPKEDPPRSQTRPRRKLRILSKTEVLKLITKK